MKISLIHGDGTVFADHEIDSVTAHHILYEIGPAGQTDLPPDSEVGDTTAESFFSDLCLACQLVLEVDPSMEIHHDIPEVHWQEYIAALKATGYRPEDCTREELLRAGVYIAIEHLQEQAGRTSELPTKGDQND